MLQVLIIINSEEGRAVGPSCFLGQVFNHSFSSLLVLKPGIVLCHVRRLTRLQSDTSIGSRGKEEMRLTSCVMR